MNKVEFYERMRINGEDVIQKKDVKILKCELKDVVYFRYNSHRFSAYDLKSGLLIYDNAKRLSELIDKVNGLKDRILEIRNSISYLQRVLKHNQDINRYVEENNE
jgi:hypothetical protein